MYAMSRGRSQIPEWMTKTDDKPGLYGIFSETICYGYVFSAQLRNL